MRSAADCGRKPSNSHWSQPSLASTTAPPTMIGAMKITMKKISPLMFFGYLNHPSPI